MVRKQLIDVLNSEERVIPLELLMQFFVDINRPIDVNKLEIITRIPQYVNNVVNFMMEELKVNTVISKEGTILHYF